GLDFREDYCKIGLLQSIIEAPVLALSATVTKEIKKDIDNVLGLSSNTVVIATLPDRPNILIDICISTENYEEELQWVQDAVEKYGILCKKIIIYVNSISACEGIYIWLHSTLCKNAYSGGVCLENRLVEMYHASTDVESKGRIMESFCRPGCTVRVLIATVACGMGMDIPDIALCVLWGLPPSMMQMWQEIGRCGRDGRDSLAICYAFPRSISLPCQKCRKSNHRKCSCEARQHLRELATTKGCYRTHCLEPFKLENIDSHTVSDANKTCTFCKSIGMCCCNLCKCCTNC
ncbi:probable ATP-dependent DNA helicase RecS, partial [Saccostrea cucullata]|uniref:probable ATP-dependent DNA helicase RecS n=1 Tax=Saccostrea cuccullata TaxID=36930 RepID=UPI002ED3EFBB